MRIGTGKHSKYLGQIRPGTARRLPAEPDRATPAASGKRSSKPFGFSVECSDWPGTRYFASWEGDGWKWGGKRWTQWYASEKARNQAATAFKRNHHFGELAGLGIYRDLRMEIR